MQDNIVNKTCGISPSSRELFAILACLIFLALTLNIEMQYQH